jgi:hypothetical protein
VKILASEGSWWNAAHAPHQRAASWNPYFYRFFGSDHSRLRPELRPLSGDESCTALTHVVAASGGHHPRPRTLRGSLRRMLSSGYRPSPDYMSLFKTLAAKAFPHIDPAKAFDALVEDSEEDPSFAVGAQAEQVGDQLTVRPHPSQDSQPTVVTFDGNVWTVKKEFLVDRSIGGVTGLLNPMNWQQLAPFFKETSRIEPAQKAADPTQPWSGILYEKVVINWNTFALQSFDTFLNIDYTVASDVVRADYSLRYEMNDQIAVDDGYAFAEKVSKDVTRYVGYKRLRFASSVFNFMTPAILCMLLEQEEGGLRDILEDEAAAVEPVVKAANAAAPRPGK